MNRKFIEGCGWVAFGSGAAMAVVLGIMEFDMSRWEALKTFWLYHLVSLGTMFSGYKLLTIWK